MFILFIVLMSLFGTISCEENDYHSDFYNEFIHSNQKISHQGQTVYLISMHSYKVVSSYSQELVRCEQYVWQADQSLGGYRLQDRIIEDIEKHELCWHNYEYSEDSLKHNIVKNEGEYSSEKVSKIGYFFDEAVHFPETIEHEILDETLMRPILVKRLLHGLNSHAQHASSSNNVDQVIVLKYSILSQMNEVTPIGCATDSSDEMHILPFPYKPEKKEQSAKEDDKPADERQLYLQLLDKAAEIEKKLSYSDYVDQEWDGILHQLFGQQFLKLTGYYQNDARSGSFGLGDEADDKVRITLINGILNIQNDLQFNLFQLSKTHGGAKVHFVFRPTKGWTSDLVECSKVKAGYTSPQAYLLAEKWKELIEEMGGIYGGGKIIHYAHSIGGSDTYAAKQLLTEDEQKIIHVITLGSPTMIPNEGFGSVVNYVSKRDGVCLFDPIGYFSGWIYPNTNIVFLGSYLGVPFVEHTLDSESYGGILAILGEQFQKDYNVKKLK